MGDRTGHVSSYSFSFHSLDIPSSWCKQYIHWMITFLLHLPHNVRHLPNKHGKTLHIFFLENASYILCIPGKAVGVQGLLYLFLTTKCKSLWQANIKLFKMYIHILWFGAGVTLWLWCKERETCNGAETKLQNILPIRDTNWITKYVELTYEIYLLYTSFKNCFTLNVLTSVMAICYHYKYYVK